MREKSPHNLYELLVILTYVTNGQMKFNFAFLHTPPTDFHPGRTELQICAKSAKG